MKDGLMDREIPGLVPVWENYIFKKTATFLDLPYPFQMALMIRYYQYEYDEIHPDIEKAQSIKDELAEKFENKLFSYGYVPTSLVIHRVMEGDVKDHGSWDEYHKWYISLGIPNHGDSVLAIIVIDAEPDFIEDGWHRFHYYIEKGLKKLPLIWDF